MKINTKTVLKDLKNNEIKNPDGTLFTLGESVGNILASSETGGKHKLFILAQKFTQDEVVELDDADFALVKGLIDSAKNYTILVTGQLLHIFEAIKNENKPDNK